MGRSFRIELTVNTRPVSSCSASTLKDCAGYELDGFEDREIASALMCNATVDLERRTGRCEVGEVGELAKLYRARE